MSVQTTHGEAWLLETFAMFRLPVWCLTRGEQATREWLNRGFHNLSRDDLERTVRQLFDIGDIEAFREDDEVGFTPATKELDAAFRKEDKKMYCGVSRAGGRRWESLAAPNWNRFFEDCNWLEDTVEITAGSQDRLQEVATNAALLWGVSMNFESLDITFLRPWQALPWKSLPVGFRSIVSFSELPCLPLSSKEPAAEYEKRWPLHVELRTWATSICGQPYV